ncbi:ABC transporter ATP-binding protein [Candidatus Peregrinibacteria bacterium]|nr:ABC transporter ATP-binding protein [Candidatus Peregrinibacteria bacterium]
MPSSNIGKLLFLLRKIHIRPIHILIPLVLSLFAAMSEGVGMGLLIPILSGFLYKSFAFVTELPYAGPWMQMLPPSILRNDRLLFVILLCGFIAVYTFKNTLKFLSIVSISYFSERTLHHLRKMLFARYLQFGKLFFDTTNIGHHSALLLDFSQRALQPLAIFDRLLNALFSLIAYFIVIFLISWKLTLVALPLFAILHFAIRTMILRIKRLSYSILNQGSNMNKKSVEILSTIPLVKAYRTERLEQQRYADISDAKARLDFRANALQAIMLPLQEIITMLVATVILVGALYIFGREQIASGPALIVYFYAIINASGKFGMISGFRGAFASSSGALDAVLSVFNDSGKHFVEDGDQVFSGLRKNIECRNLTFSYTDRSILKNISLTIVGGQMTAIVGPTGAGKSTLISLLMRYYDCPPGSIFIDGKDIRYNTLDSYLAHMAVVSQETLLLHDSLKNNITYGLHDVSDSALMEAVRAARLEDFVKQLPCGLDTLIGDRGVRLSGGEKQRVSIARALLKGAGILILDEATSSLDSQTEQLIQDAIDEAITGRTAIVIAHRLSTIKHADKIIVLKDGKVAEEGTLEELLKRNGAFFHLWEEQKF